MVLQTSRIRQVSEQNLPDTATILYQPVIISDGMGGEGEESKWEIWNVDVECRISSLYGSERLIGAGIDPIKDVLIVFKLDYNITEEKRILINGKTYEILYVVPEPSYAAMTRVIGREI